MRNKPTISQNYEWETGNRAGVVRDFLSLCQLYPKRMALACTFAVSAACISEQTIETAIDPRNPNFIGMQVLGQYFTNTHYRDEKSTNRPTRYSEYLRDFYNRNPEVATADIASAYGVRHRGDFQQTIFNILNPTGQRKEDDIVSEQDRKPLKANYPIAQALNMYLIENAYGAKGYSNTDLAQAYITFARQESGLSPK